MVINEANWNSNFLQANGLRFHAVTEGEGPVVLMLHGFPENWYSWRHQIPALAKAGYRAAAVDLRGYNKSDRPARVEDYHLDRLVDDVGGMIEALGGGPVHLVAHDWGGVIAWNAAARMPEKLRSLTILNAPHPKVFRKHLLTNIRQMGRSWYVLFFQIPWLPEWAIATFADRLFVKNFRGMARRKEMFPDEAIAVFREAMLTPGALTAGISYYRALFRDFHSFGKAKEFPNLTVPTQVIWGDNDVALGRELCDGLETYFDGPFEIHFIEGSSHWVQQEEPEQVNLHLIDFLNRNRG